MRASVKSIRQEHTDLVPVEKNLSPEWLTSLTARGEPRVYSGKELEHIGFPVGGICTGQVYLSGDGRLCHWDVFKAYGGRNDTGDPWGPHYADPIIPQPEFEQGFAVRVVGESGARIQRLDATGFASVAFRGAYPLATVDFADDGPVSIQLEAFSPFSPLDADDSGLPATILNYTICNHSDRAVDVEIGGWMANNVCPFTPAPEGQRINCVSVEHDFLAVNFAARFSGSRRPEGFGGMALSLLAPQPGDRVLADIGGGQDPAAAIFSPEMPPSVEVERDFPETAIGAVSGATANRAGSISYRYVRRWMVFSLLFGRQGLSLDAGSSGGS